MVVVTRPYWSCSSFLRRLHIKLGKKTNRQVTGGRKGGRKTIAVQLAHLVTLPDGLGELR